MRSAVVAILAVIITAVAGYALCLALGRDPHVRSLLLAASAALAASVMSAVPVMLARGGGSVAVTQASLLGTVLHMFVMLVAAATVIFTRAADGAFIYWLLAFYLATLLAVAGGSIAALRSAGAEPQAGAGATAAGPAATQR